MLSDPKVFNVVSLFAVHTTNSNIQEVRVYVQIRFTAIEYKKT